MSLKSWLITTTFMVFYRLNVTLSLPLNSSWLTLSDMGFFEPSVMGAWVPNHNVVVIAPMIMKFSTGIKLDGNKKICDVTTIT